MNSKETSRFATVAEARYRATLVSIGDGVISTDAWGQVDFMNPAAERLTGWNEAAAQTKPLDEVFRVVDEKTRVVAESPVARMLREGHAVERINHTILVSKDGREFPIAGNVAPRCDANGAATGAVLVFRNQSEEHQARAAVLASETRYRRLFESAKDGILILDADTGKIVDVNPFLIELTGYSHDDFLGAYLWEIGPFKDTANSKEAFAKLLTEKYVRYDNLPLQARDGRKVSVEFVSNVYRVDGQNVIQCNIRDITERKRAEETQRLRARWSEALLKLLQFPSRSETEIVAYAVETLVALTESKLCFIGCVDSEENTMSGHVWSQHAMQECALAGGKAVQFDVAQGGLWTASIRQHQAIIVNDYAAAHPYKKGYPAGHVLLTRFLGVPVIREGRTVLVAGLANKVEEYGEAAASETLMFLEGLWGVLNRNRAVDALRLKNLVFDASISANSIADVTGVITEANAAFLRMWAYASIDEVVGKPLPQFFNDPNEAVAVLAALNGTGHWEGDFSAVRSDGSVFMAHGLATTLRDAQGSIVGYQSAVLDITERKQAEETLAASEARYRSYIEATGQIGWVTTPHGEVVEDVPSLRQFSGQTYEEMKGCGWEKTLHPDDLELTRQTWNCAVTTKSAYEAEYRMRRYDGVYRDLLARGFPVFREDGTIREWVGTCLDITDRKRAEEALRASESEFRTLAEAMPQIVWITRPDGSNIFFNQQWMDYTGLSLEESLGHGWNKPFHPDDQQRAWDAWKKATLENCTYSLESRLRRADGAYRWWLVRGVPKLDAAGNIIKWYGTCTDIHDLKMAEQGRKDMQIQLQASQKLDAIGSLAGGVAHDFNNLLSVILGYIGFAMGAVRDGDPLKDDLLEVKKAAERAAALTRQLLAFSRKQVLQPVTMSLNQIATGVEKMLRRILGEDIDFLQTLAPDLGVVQADPGQIEQVLMNLVVNARDAMPEGGELTIETSNVEIDEEYAASHVAVKPGAYVQLAVTDTGCGMDENTKARIFEPFFTTKEKGKGTGLGLSTVYGIVKQSGGNIWVYSELGQGTTFKIYLPRELSVTTTVGVKPSTVSKQMRGTETILLVEDEEALRKVALRTLSAAGYTVLTAGNGEEALVTCAQQVGDIHLLLTDVVMPRMSGRVLAQELSKKRPTVKVLYMSGYTDDAIVHHGVLDAGMQFLTKPFTAENLTRKVREVLDLGITNSAEGHESVANDKAEVEKEQPLDKSALRTLPVDVVAKLRTAVVAARYNELLKIIEIVRTTEPNLATALLKMADLFDYDGMRHFLNSGKEDEHGR